MGIKTHARSELIKNRFEKEKPLKGLTLAACLHVTKETAVLSTNINRWRRQSCAYAVLTLFQPKTMLPPL